jgi:hypothetical protein
MARRLSDKARCWTSGKRSSLVRSHVFPELILVQPDSVGIPGDEFLDGQAFYQLRSWNPLLPAVNKDCHKLLLSFAPRSLLGGGSFAFRFFHVLFLVFTHQYLSTASATEDYCSADRPWHAAEISTVG